MPPLEGKMVGTIYLPVVHSCWLRVTGELSVQIPSLILKDPLWAPLGLMSLVSLLQASLGRGLAGTLVLAGRERPWFYFLAVGGHAFSFLHQVHGNRETWWPCPHTPQCALKM